MLFAIDDLIMLFIKNLKQKNSTKNCHINSRNYSK